MVCAAPLPQVPLTKHSPAGGVLRVNTKDFKAWTFGTAIERCHATVWSSARSRLKLKALADEAGRFFSKDTKLPDITADRIDDYTIHLKKSEGNSNVTVNRKLATLQKVLTFSMQRTDASGLNVTPHIQRQREGIGVSVCSPKKKSRHSWPPVRCGARLIIPTPSPC